jgi:hypothetical protein
VGARVAVQQQDGRAGAAVAYPQLRLADIDALQRKAFEHGPLSTGNIPR